MDHISQAATDEIVGDEVTSQATYEAKYRHPTWSGDFSGVTIGIGYDVGQSTAAQVEADWKGLIPDSMVQTLVSCVGVTGAKAKSLTASVRDRVDVPWAAAMSVFLKVDVPRWYDICVKHLPNFEELPLDCKGALVSLTFNRGASFEQDGDRYKEMRNIKRHMTDRRPEIIPEEIRGMKRLWTDGLVARREREAVLFEQGLAKGAEPEKPDNKAPAPDHPSTAPSSWGSILGKIIDAGHVHVEIGKGT